MNNFIPENKEIGLVSESELEEVLEEEVEKHFGSESYCIYENEITDYDIEAGINKGACFSRARSIPIELFEPLEELGLLENVYFEDPLIKERTRSKFPSVLPLEKRDSIGEYNVIEAKDGEENYGIMKIGKNFEKPSVIFAYGVVEGEEDDPMEKYFSRVFVASKAPLEGPEFKWNGGRLEMIGEVKGD